jgi:hypothetical protein
LENDLAGHLIVAVGAAGFFGFVCWTLWSGEFTIKGGRTYTRKNDPVVYWILTTFFAIFALIFVPIVLFVLFGRSGVGPK